MKKICIEEAKEYLPNIAMNKLIKKIIDKEKYEKVTLYYILYEYRRS